MRRVFAISSLVLLGCAPTAPLPPQKTVQTTTVVPAPSSPSSPAPLAAGQANAEILKTESLRAVERLPLWRTWATDTSQPLLQAHALTQLAWMDDAERFSFATKAFESSYTRVRVVAARILAMSGPSNSIRKALLDSLSAASGEERSAILWTLVVHGEKSVASKALDELRSGALTKVTQLDGRNAFDALLLADLFTSDELGALAKDSNAAVRQFVATRFALRADGQATDILVKLLQDSDDSVSALAAGGLARGADKRGHEALLGALGNASKERRQKWLEGVRELAGGPGLVLMLGSIPAKPPETVWFQTKQIFSMLESLADPRVADPLIAWVAAAKPHAHWLGQTGIRLAEVGDIRGAKFIGARLRLEPEKLHSQERFWEADEGGHLSRSDLPRVVGARMLADLAMIHQDKHAELLTAAEDGTLYWLHSRFQPHANGLRFLAAAGSTKVLSDLRKWAFPPDPLPKKGDSPPFPAAFETAQMSLRYIGLRKDEPSFSKLIDQLQRKKDKTMNITQEGLMDGGMAMLGMSLRAIGYGASNGLAHWGDVRAVKPLMTFIEDETWHEEARQSACEALAWCADAKTMSEVANKVQTFGQSSEPSKKLIAACYAQTLSLKPMPEIVPMLIEALGPSASAELRMAYGRAIGMSGFDAASQGKLFRKLEDPASRHAAALALILGGNGELAARTVAQMADFGPAVLDELKDHYYRAFGYWSDVDFERGNIYRWVANAEAISHVEVAGVTQEWARQRLQSQFANLSYDNGPHSETRVVLRSRLLKEARTADAERKRGAIMTLAFMQERGTLLALRDEPGETGALARQALHRVTNPVPMAAE